MRGGRRDGKRGDERKGRERGGNGRRVERVKLRGETREGRKQATLIRDVT